MRRTLLALSVLALLPACPRAALATAGAATGTVTLSVTKVEPGKGAVYISLCTAAEFMRRCALRRKAEASADTVAVTFDAVPPGRYAAMAWQDFGDDGKMASGVFGEPLEPTGASRDATGMMGPPSFDDAAFDVAEGSVTQSFRLR